MVRFLLAIPLCLLLASPALAQRIVWYPANQFGQTTLRMPQSTLIPESSFNTIPNFEPIGTFTASNRYRKLGQAVGRLDMLMEEPSTGRRGTGTCTATIISREHILTNYHCIPGSDAGVRVRRAVLQMAYLSDDQDATSYTVSTTPVEANESLDYAILRVQGNPSARYGTVPLYVRDPQPNEELFLIHHPAGMTQRITRRGCRLSDSSRALYGTELRHRCDTKGGSSGSLIFSDNNEGDRFYVVGLHYAGFRQQSRDAYNSAKRFTELLKRSPILRSLARSSSTSGGSSSTRSSIASTLKLNPKPPYTTPSTSTPNDRDALAGIPMIDRISFNGALNAHFTASADQYRKWRYGQDQRPRFPVLGASNSNMCLYLQGSGTSNAVRANCKVAVEGSFDAARAMIRSRLQAANARIIADDARGLAARLPNGTTACLHPRAYGGLFANSDGRSVHTLYLNSPDDPAPTCFTDPPISLK
ncbi:MAG: hypothetical protein RhofKO_38570 [Rhodothermales bacterium]